MRLFLPLSLSIFLAGCATEAQHLQMTPTPLAQDSSFYVPLCADGNHEGHQQAASGLMTSQLLSAELTAHTQRVETGQREENLQTALISARERNLDYVAFPFILNWKNEATPMASVPDKVKVRIDIIDVASANVIDSIVLQQNTSKMATSKTPPQELLAEPLKEYVTTLIPQHQTDESEQGFWGLVRSLF